MGKVLKLSPDALEELKKVDSYEFDVFKLRELTEGNELFSLLPFTLAKHGLIATTGLHFCNLLNFLRRLQAGYKNITYHNTTHATDVC